MPEEDRRARAREGAPPVDGARAGAEITNRFAEIEAELESFANLYVASFQLHSSLRVRAVVRHVKELLEQLVGRRSLAIYFADEAERRLVPIASDGVELSTLPDDRPRRGPTGRSRSTGGGRRRADVPDGRASYRRG